MGKVSMVVGMLLVLGLVAVGQTPENTCWRVQPTTAGSFLLQAENTWTKAARELIIIFAEPVLVPKALAFGATGGAGEGVITGEGRVWYVRFATPVAPKGWLLQAFSTVTPVTVDACKFIRKIIPTG